MNIENKCKCREILISTYYYRWIILCLLRYVFSSGHVASSAGSPSLIKGCIWDWFPSLKTHALWRFYLRIWSKMWRVDGNLTGVLLFFILTWYEYWIHFFAQPPRNSPPKDSAEGCFCMVGWGGPNQVNQSKSQTVFVIACSKLGSTLW